jgi:CheY-like chemotaxis protein
VREQDSALHDARMAHIHAPDEEPAPLREPVSVIAFGDEADALAALARQVKPVVRLAWTTTADDVASLAARERASLVILDIGSRQGAAWRVAHALSEMKVEVPPAILLLPEIIAQRDAPAIGGAGLDLGWVALVPKPFTSDQLARAVSTAAGQRDSAETRGGPDAIEVLVIDDDEDSRRVASRVLREKGIRVRESVDGENGLVEMRVRPPDVVVLDLMMPVLDGFGVLATMRARVRRERERRPRSSSRRGARPASPGARARRGHRPRPRTRSPTPVRAAERGPRPGRDGAPCARRAARCPGRAPRSPRPPPAA